MANPQGLQSVNEFIDTYATMIIPYYDELGCSDAKRTDVLSAGLFCWYGQLLYYVSRYGIWTNNDHPVNESENKNKSENKNEEILRGSDLLSYTFDLALLYVYFDHYLDVVPDSDRNKAKTMSNLVSLMQNPDLDIHIPGLTGMVLAYKRLVKKQPKLIEDMFRLYIFETTAHKLQTGKELSEWEYLQIAKRKGGFTTLTIKTLITGENDYDEGCYDVGGIVQMLDDMMDVHEDIAAGINNIATYEIRKNGNMDRLFAYTARSIDGLPDKFVLFKPVMMTTLTYILSQPGKFSRRLQRNFSQSIYVNWQEGYHALTLMSSWISRRVAELRSQ